MKSKKQEEELAYVELCEGDTVEFYEDGHFSNKVIKLSPDGSTFLYRSETALFFSKTKLANILLLSYGPRTKTFAKYDWANEKPWLCFSLVTTKGAIDVQCPDKATLFRWYLGLQHFVPLSFKNLKRPRLNWYYALYKTVQLAHYKRMPVAHVWRILVEDVKQIPNKFSGEGMVEDFRMILDR